MARQTLTEKAQAKAVSRAANEAAQAAAAQAAANFRAETNDLVDSADENNEGWHNRTVLFVVLGAMALAAWVWYQNQNQTLNADLSGINAAVEANNKDSADAFASVIANQDASRVRDDAQDKAIAGLAEGQADIIALINRKIPCGTLCSTGIAPKPIPTKARSCNISVGKGVRWSRTACTRQQANRICRANGLDRAGTVGCLNYRPKTRRATAHRPKPQATVQMGNCPVGTVPTGEIRNGRRVCNILVTKGKTFTPNTSKETGEGTPSGNGRSNPTATPSANGESTAAATNSGRSNPTATPSANAPSAAANGESSAAANAPSAAANAPSAAANAPSAAANGESSAAANAPSAGGRSNASVSGSN